MKDYRFPTEDENWWKSVLDEVEREVNSHRRKGTAKQSDEATRKDSLGEIRKAKTH